MCEICHTPIQNGDKVRVTDDGPVHADCAIRVGTADGHVGWEDDE